MKRLKYKINTMILMISMISMIFGAQAQAGPAGIELIKSTVGRYQKSCAVEIQVQKSVTLALLDEKKVSEGRLLLSKGRMRLEIEKPDSSMVIMDKNTIWLVTPTPKELGGRTQVLRIRSRDLKKQSRAPIAALLGKASAWDQFKVKSEQEKEGLIQYVLVPKSPEALGDIMSVGLVVDKKEKVLRSLSYKDELDNETVYEFEKTNFSAKTSEKSFSYVPSKDADVTEY